MLEASREAGLAQSDSGVITLPPSIHFSDFADGMRAEWRYVVADSGYEGPDWVTALNPSTSPSYLCALGQVTKPRGVLFLSI